MHLSVYSCIIEEFSIVLHEFPARFFIQTALWEWHNQQAFNDLEYVGKTPIGRVPVLFESVHADFSWRRRNIRMEDLRQEVPYSMLKRC